MNMNRPTHLLYRIATLVLALLCAGCTGLQAPQMEIPKLYLLDARPIINARQVKRDLVLAVGMPRAGSGFDTPKMAYQRQPHQLDYFVSSRWADTPPHMLEPLLAEALEHTGSFRAIVRTPGSLPANLRLDTELV